MGFFDLFFGKQEKTFSYGNVSSVTISKISSDWSNISSLLKQKSPSQLRQALITADKTLDAALKDVVPGETMGERLKNAKEKFDRVTYSKLWEAHKLRNSVVHEAGFEPPHFMVIEAVSNIKEGLYKLGVRV